MLVAEEQIVDADLILEIRTRGASPPNIARELRRFDVCLLEQSRLFAFQAGSAVPEPHHLSVLIDPVVEEISPHDDASHGSDTTLCAVDVFPLSGVTDTEGEMAARALSLAGLPGIQCRAGYRYRWAAPVERAVRGMVERSLGNPLIQGFVWSDDPGPSVAFSEEQPIERSMIASVDLRDASDEMLLTLSADWGLALSLDEMRTIAGHCAAMGRALTDVELQSLALTWSEHCSHKTFKAAIQFTCDGTETSIPHGLLRTYLAAPTAQLNRPWVRSAFVDNAGVIAFDGRYDLAFKVETHNHPSALEPYGGAHTGVGGVIRDVLGVSAEPIANTDVLCFGPSDLAETAVPPGTFHPRVTYERVVRGVADYGNNMGIPTVGGAVLFHPGYTANPLVYCGTLGLVPRASHPCEPRAGDLVVLLGGRTGRDGLHGATMSSAALDRQTVAGSTVQIGAPITEKIVRDVLPLLRDEGLYHAVTDCGAGGLCSAVGEMGADLGVDVDLERVPLKYEGLVPWEIWLSEAQERMVLAVSPTALPRLTQLCEAHDLAVSSLGHFTGDGQLRVRHRDLLVADLTMSFLHGGQPRRVLQALWETPQVARMHAQPSGDPSETLLRLLSHPSIASKEAVIRRYDHEVGAATVIKPLVGNAGPSDAALLRPVAGSQRGVVVAQGINPLYGEQDPYAMALLTVDEALRNLVAIGGSIDRAALLDNFCWGDVDDPAELGALVRAAQGCRDAALAFRVPFVSGKDSLRNTTTGVSGRLSIPRTLLISAFGSVPDVSRTVTMDLKAAESLLYVLGETGDELGGSHLYHIEGWCGGQVPQVRLGQTPQLMRRLTRAIRRGLVRSCHDLSEGGLAVAAAEMVIAGGWGMEIRLDSAPRSTDDRVALLFAESPGRFLVEVADECAEAFEQLMNGLPVAQVGKTVPGGRLCIEHDGVAVVNLEREVLERAWKQSPELSSADTTSSVASCLDPTPSSNLRAPGVSVPARRIRTGMQALVLTAPGVNCDRETLEACRLAGWNAESVHLNQILSGARKLTDFGFLVLPGGFSYGDHLGAGAMLAATLRYRLLDGLWRFVEEGRPVLGICNGFQILARLGLLGDLTLLSNGSGRFECRWVRLRVEESPCPFLQGLDYLELPVAHGQGRVVIAEGGTVPHAPLRYLDNPNGSVDDIAGVSNAAGNVFGLMPHPERYLDRFHHPDWQRRPTLPPTGGTIFRNAIHVMRRAG